MDDKTRTTKPRGASGQVTAEHEALARLFMEVMYTVMQETATSIGTVIGDDGGKVRVQIDEESGPREVGFPRMRGQRFTAGQRVPVHRAKGGNEFLGGSISSQGGRDPAVDKADLMGGAADWDIVGQDVKNNIGDAKKAGTDAQDAANKAMDEAKAKADKNHSHSNYASDNHSHNIGDLPGDVATKKWVEDNFQKK